jgi:hypothetical protein
VLRGAPAILARAARRLLVLLASVSAATALGGLAVGAIAGMSVDRSVSISFYAVGSFLLIGGFFVGNRGPARQKDDDTLSSFIPFIGSRSVRWASLEEQHETINLSAIFVVTGFLLVMIGIAVDNRHGLL